MTMMQHQLVGNTLRVEADGISAECTCGWKTRGRFSSMVASNAFQDHLDETVAKQENSRAETSR